MVANSPTADSLPYIVVVDAEYESEWYLTPMRFPFGTRLESRGHFTDDKTHQPFQSTDPNSKPSSLAPCASSVRRVGGLRNRTN